jgi:hypothetical protein
MAPLVAALIQAGLPILAKVVTEKGKEFVNNELGVDLDAQLSTQTGTDSLRIAEREHELTLLRILVDADGAESKEREGARARDIEIQRSKGINFRADALCFIAAIVIVGLTASIWFGTNLDDFGKGVLTLVLGRFLGYLDNIYNFEFGSTRSSKTKNDAIAALAKEHTK